jgi:hypothetical protein
VALRSLEHRPGATPNPSRQQDDKPAVTAEETILVIIFHVVGAHVLIEFYLLGLVARPICSKPVRPSTSSTSMMSW